MFWRPRTDLPGYGRQEEVAIWLGMCVQAEMAGCQLPMLDSTCADDLRPHTLHAFTKLHLLPGVLDRVPPPVIWPTSCGTPQVLCCLPCFHPLDTSLGETAIWIVWFCMLSAVVLPSITVWMACRNSPIKKVEHNRCVAACLLHCGSCQACRW